MNLKIYKPEQGRAVRLAVYLSSLVMVLWGCFNLYYAFPLGGMYETLAGPLDLFGVELRVTPMLLISAGVFAVFAVALHLFFNWPRMAEFLIETEGELKRVSWPERKEYMGASVAVVILVVFIVAYLYAVDIGLTYVLTWLKIGF